jgi:ferredoxin
MAHRSGSFAMPVINFVKEKKKIEVPEGANLRKEAMKAGVQVYPGIHRTFHLPFGLCTSCRVKIVKGGETHVQRAGWFERLRMLLGPITFFARLGCEKELRMSCQTKVLGDIDVETQPGVNWHGEKYWA